MELFSLVLANTTFLLLSRLHHQSHLCEGMVFALHYFYLVTMAWSLIAALTFYTQVHDNIVHQYPDFGRYGLVYNISLRASPGTCWTSFIKLPI